MCREIGITRNDTEIPLHKLDYHIRADLDSTSPRALAVLCSLRLVLTNLPEDYSQSVQAKVCAFTAMMALPRSLCHHFSILCIMPGCHAGIALQRLTPATCMPLLSSTPAPEVEHGSCAEAGLL